MYIIRLTFISKNQIISHNIKDQILFISQELFSVVILRNFKANNRQIVTSYF